MTVPVPSPAVCPVCDTPIEPEPRFFTDDGKPRHMQCDENGGDFVVLGKCAHGVDLDRDFCPEGCRV